MKYFIDTEFNERGRKHPIELISIAMVREDGDGIYALNSLFDRRHATPFVRDHVLPHLPKRPVQPVSTPGPHNRYVSVTNIRRVIRDLVGDDPAPEFWGYFCAFDYVVLSQLMGGFEQWPAGWPFYMHDLRQALDARGLSQVSQPDDAPHDALQDARWIKATYDAHIRDDEIAIHT